MRNVLILVINRLSNDNELDCAFTAIEKVLQDHIVSVHQKSQSKIPPSLMELIPEK